jgi:CHAT domain-containing protein
LIVPNGVLHYLPFAVLTNDENGSKLLIDQVDIAYLPSASALVSDRTPPAPSRELLALAPDRSGLVHAAQEVQQIARLHRRPEALLGPQATETVFKQSAGAFGVVHLATHAFFNQANPMFSGLQLEPSRDDDGRLEVHEILKMRLNASLITLSACGTALAGGRHADVPPGEDFVGLTRAFLATGSSAVLATLWDLNDRAAVPFMEQFYGGYRSMNPYTAVAHAQRQMRKRSGHFAHPYYWGGFVLVTASPEQRR